MEPAELILSILGSSTVPLDGRTTVQKIAYFASIKAEVPLEYKPHFYGPYSSGVAGLLADLVSGDFVEETSRMTTHDRIMYSYFLTEDGKKLLERVQKQEPSEYATIAGVVDKCHKIVKNNIYVLSWAAKVYFMLSQQGTKISYEKAMEMGQQLGWKLTAKEIDSGAKLLAGLGLAFKSKAA